MKHFKTLFFFSFVLCLLLFAQPVCAQPISGIFEEWTTTEGTQNFFIKTEMAIDDDNNVIVVGATLNGNNDYDLLVAKYNTAGELLWIDQYDGTGNGNDIANAIAIDESGNVFVTGSTFTSSLDTLDVITVGYDTDGTRLWLDVYTGSGNSIDWGTCIAYSDGAVYVGGLVTLGLPDYLALKYNTSGTLLWSEEYDYASLPEYCVKIVVDNASVYLGGATYVGGNDWDMLVVELDIADGTYVDDAIESGGSLGFWGVRAMERDLGGNIYLTGCVVNPGSGVDIHTVKIDGSMNVEWAEDFTSDGLQRDEGMTMAFDDNGNVYVGGYKDSVGQATDFVTLKYDDAGNLEWSAYWNDSANGADTVKAMVVDGAGNVTVTGTAWNGSSLDYHTIQYDNTGALLWEIDYNDKYNFTDAPSDIAISPDGGIVVAGQAMNPDSTWSYVTVKYLMHGFVVPVDSDSVSSSLRWIANRDQLLGTDGELVERVRFYSNQVYPNMYFMDDSLSYVFFQGVDTTDDDTLHRIDMTFDGSSSEKRLIPLEKETYWNNYYLGHIPEGRPFVSLYDRMYMQDVWPNIDVVYSSNQRGLKYYLVVHDAGETGAIALKYHGYEDLYVDGDDALVIESEIGEVVQPQALAYEMDGSGELSLLGWQPEYDVNSGVVTFAGLGSWTGDLVIEVNWGYVNARAARSDNLHWSTYFGGIQNDKGLGIDVNRFHEVYNTGYTQSPLFPYLNAIYTFQGTQDIYMAKFKEDAVQLWTTFFGGSGNDGGTSVISDLKSFSSAYTGYTSSTDFPTGRPMNPNLLLQDNYGGGAFDAFIVQLAANGTRMWSTYFGGTGDDRGYAITSDENNKIYIGGSMSTYVDFDSDCDSDVTPGEFPLCDPGSNAYFQQPLNAGVCLLAHFDLTQGFVWGTAFGGGTNQQRVNDLIVDPQTHDLYVVGASGHVGGSLTTTTTYPSTCQSNLLDKFPLCDPGSGAYMQSTDNNGGGFVAMFSPTHELKWSTLFGGNIWQNLGHVAGVAINSQSELYINGIGAGDPVNSCQGLTTYNFPWCDDVGGSYVQPTVVGINDAYIARFDSMHNLIWATPFGGENIEFTSTDLSRINGMDLSIDPDDNVFFVGTVAIPSLQALSATNFPTTSHGNWFYDADYGNISEPEQSGDAFVAAFGLDNVPFWCTIFGGGRNANSGAGFPNGAEDGVSIAVDDTFAVYITGGTGSPFTPNVCPVPVSGTPYCQSEANMNGVNIDAYISRFDFTEVQVSTTPRTIVRNNIVAYPNPTSDRISIEFSLQKPMEVGVLISNAVGSIVAHDSYKMSKGDQKKEFDLRSAPPGIYILQLRIGNEFYSTKVIKIGI